MGTVHHIARAAGDVTLGRAAEAYLATLSGAEQASTRRTYGRGVLRWVVTEFGSEASPDIDVERFAAWFTATWGDRSPSTWNVSSTPSRSAAAYWQRQGWVTADPSRMLKRRQPRPDRSRALSRADVERLLTREDIGIRERTLWRLLYESAARSAEALGRSTWKTSTWPTAAPGSAARAGPLDWITWQTGTARLLPRLLRERSPARCS